MSEYVEFNINNYVLVQLTDIGKGMLKSHHDDLNKFAHGLLGDFSLPDEDENGYSKWQMWDLMSKIGTGFRNGANPPIYTSIKIEVNNSSS